MPRPTRNIDPDQVTLADDITSIVSSMKRIDAQRQGALWSAHVVALEKATDALKKLTPAAKGE